MAVVWIMVHDLRIRLQRLKFSMSSLGLRVALPSGGKEPERERGMAIRAHALLLDSIQGLQNRCRRNIAPLSV